MSSFENCNPDLVIEMQEMGVGVDDVLQYARGAFTRDELRSLAYGLERMLGNEPCAADRFEPVGSLTL